MAENLALKGIRTFDVGMRGKVHLGVLRGSVNGEKVPFLDIHPLVDRFNSTHKSTAPLIHPWVADAVLTGHPDNWKFFAEHGCLVFPTSLIVAYRAPGEKLGFGPITSSGRNGLQLQYPTEIWHERQDIALGCEAKTANFYPFDANVMQIRPDRLDHQDTTVPGGIIIDMPARSGHYKLLDGMVLHFESPAAAGLPDARFVWRDDSGKDIVAPVVRETGTNGERIRVISLNCSPFDKYGVVVEIPANDLHKFVPQ